MNDHTDWSRLDDWLVGWMGAKYQCTVRGEGGGWGRVRPHGNMPQKTTTNYRHRRNDLYWYWCGWWVVTCWEKLCNFAPINECGCNLVVNERDSCTRRFVFVVVVWSWYHCVLITHCAGVCVAPRPTSASGGGKKKLFKMSLMFVFWKSR